MSGHVDGHLPLKADVFEILAALSTQDLHGYAILKEIEARGVRLAASLLYRKLRRLLEDGLVVETDEPVGEGGWEDPRRRRYRLTPLGREIAASEARRIVELAESERVRRMAGGSRAEGAAAEVRRGV